MSQTTRYSTLMLFIMIIVVISGCIVPTKEEPASAGSQSGSINYLVPGTVSGSQQPLRFDVQTKGIPGSSPTPTRIMEETLYLTPIPTYDAISDMGPTYRNLTMLVEPTPIIPVYKEIFHSELSLKDHTVAYAYELQKPPLVINFDIKPKVDTRTIWYENKSQNYNSKGYRPDVFVTIRQISPNAWFEVIVRDKLTGNIVLDEGFGRNFGGNTNRTTQVRSSGNYRIDMSGNEVNVTVRMHIPDDTT